MGCPGPFLQGGTVAQLAEFFIPVPDFVSSSCLASSDQGKSPSLQADGFLKKKYVKWLNKVKK